MKWLVRLVLAILTVSPLVQAQVLKTSDAKDHVGENATVCGLVASEHTAAGRPGEPTFLNLDRPYPNQTFTVLMWNSDKASVGVIPKTGRICVKGTISLYKGIPEIVAHSSADLYVPTLGNNRSYTNSDGAKVHSPGYSSGGPPQGATALCNDGTYSFSQHRQGTCSHHAGVSKWLPQ
jgi:Protein of unknown function (DUF3761)